MSNLDKELYAFGPFVLDPQERVVFRHAVPLPMTPKVFDTLLYLVCNQGRILTKDELLQKIWPGTFVEEVNLAVNISTLRKALGDSPQDGRYIVTVSGRGYRFVAQVRKTIASGEEALNGNLPSDSRVEISGEDVPGAPGLRRASLSESSGENGAMARPPEEAMAAVVNSDSTAMVSPWSFSAHRKVAALAALMVLLATAIGIFVWRQHKGKQLVRPVSASIAVLPFADLSPDRNQEYFSDGLVDELTDDLEKVRGLKVIARSSAFQFRGKNEDLRTVGKKLGVANILEGSVRREGNRVRITAALTKVDDGFQLWSETYDRQIDDVFVVQNDIARAVTVALQVRIMDPGQETRSAHFRRNPAAYEPYLQAQYFLARGEDKEDLKNALSYVDQAITKDPTYGPAWALRSMVLYTSATIGLRNHEEGYREAREDAEKSIALDPNSASGYVALAWVKIGYEWDWQGAEAALEKAADLQPGSAVVLSYHAYLYECLGRLDEAIALTQEASRLDPLRANSYLGALLYSAGRYEEAQTALREALSINPKLEGAHYQLGKVLIARGRAQDALTEITMEPGEWERWTGEALVYHALDRPNESNAALSKLIATHAEDSPFQVAEVYAFNGDSNRAFEWLNRAYSQRDPGLNQLKLDPLLKNLHADSRYAELLKKVFHGYDAASDSVTMEK